MAAWSDHEARDACKEQSVDCPYCEGRRTLTVEPFITCYVCAGSGQILKSQAEPRRRYMMLIGLAREERG